MFHMFFRSLRYYVAFMNYGKYMSLSIADKKCWNVKSGGQNIITIRYSALILTCFILNFEYLGQVF